MATKKTEDQEQELDLEQSLKNLEAIVDKLENGNVALDEAFRIFEEGSRLSERINEKVSSYERKLQVLNKQYQLEGFDEAAIIDSSEDKED